MWLKKQYFKDPNDTHRKKKSEDSATLNNFIRNLKSPELADLTDTKQILDFPKQITYGFTNHRSYNDKLQ